jgi:hypothetical protein
VVLLVAILGTVAVAGYMAWPHLAPILKPSTAGWLGSQPDDAGDDLDEPGEGGDDRGDDTPRTAGKSPLGGNTGRRKAGLPGNPGPFPRRALVVSINNYIYANPIPYGVVLARGRNVHAMRTHLTNTLKIPRDQVAVLSDAGPVAESRPTIAPILRGTITSFLATSRAQDRILLLVIGHVIEVEDQFYLVPADGDPEDKGTLIPFPWLYDSLAAYPARQKVLVLDTCRFDPSRGQVRPGSGPMSEKLDALLNAPPSGVQVWSSCVAGQYSYDLGEAETPHGLFLDELYSVLERGLENMIQSPGDPFPLERLRDEVNGRMKAALDPYGKTQTSRLSGTEPAEGAEPDESEPRPARLTVAAGPGGKGDHASLPSVKAILKEISFPILKVDREEHALTAEAMPPFTKNVMEEYLAEKAKTPLRDAVENARQVLADLSGRVTLQDRFSAPADENRFKAQIMKDQTELANEIQKLKDALDELVAAGKEHRANESKRWQANYDYAVARLEAQIAYMIEYQALVGSLRKELPARDPKIHNGWRLASHRDPQGGDSEANKLTRAARSKLDKIIQTYKDTPWAIVARRDKYGAMGLEWQPTK